jgi:uncharacterized membrane protein
MEPILINKKEYGNLFEISLIIKAINAIADVLGGIIIWFTSKIVLVTFVLNILQHELSDDPKDYVAKFIVNSAEALSVNSQYFLGGYLLIHGVVKIFLLICLYKKKLWAYPVSIIIFSIIIFYETYLFYFSHSLWTLAFILFDILLVLLTWHEYYFLKINSNEKIL